MSLTKETAQIVRIVRPKDEPSVEPQEAGDFEGQFRSGYYFLISRKTGGQFGKRIKARTLTTFGPFDDSHTARFIKTSAYALGLLPAADSEKSSTPGETAVNNRRISVFEAAHLSRQSAPHRPHWANPFEHFAFH